MWRAETPPQGWVEENYPRESPTHFDASPEDLTSLLGEANSRDDESKTTHSWDVTDGTSWVHVYNYKHRNSFSMRGDTPDATIRFLDFVKGSIPVLGY